MSRIETIRAREVFDSRGNPTVEVEVVCQGCRPGRAIVPSGASTGRFESAELRDRESNRLDGMGVRRAVENVCKEIATALKGMDAQDQEAVDRRLCELDGTDNKSRLGANAILGTSLAVAVSAAESRDISLVSHLHELWRKFSSSAKPSSAERTESLAQKLLLPMPMVNMISGGLHAGRNLDFQDFLVIPLGAHSFREALDWIVAVYRRLGRLLHQKGYEGYLVGDEGGYGPALNSNSEAVEFLLKAIEDEGLTPGSDIAIGLDVASSHFYQKGRYRLAATGTNELEPEEFIGMLESWVDNYPIVSIEDGLTEDDWTGWKNLTQRLGDRVQLIGDDLFATNKTRLQQGIESAAGNSVLVKLNQIGTLTETLETLRLALDHDYWPVISARSGETEDPLIADLVVATGAGQIKVGSVARSERLAKYNQLLRLEEQLGNEAGYLGGSIFQSLNCPWR